MKNIILGSLFLLVFASCATVTKGQLGDPVGSLNKPVPSKRNQKVSIEYRMLIESKMEYMGQKNMFLASNDKITDSVDLPLNQFKDASVDVIQMRYDFDRIGSAGRNYEENLKKISKVDFPLKSDYLIQMELFRNINPVQEIFKQMFISFGAIFHVVSLGLIPVTASEDINIRLTLYDKNGKVLNQKEVANSARVWLWSPLVFFGGKSIFVTEPEEMFVPAVQNTVDHAIRDLKFSP